MRKIIKHYKTKSITALLLCLLMSFATAYSQAPTKDETINFMTTTLNGAKGTEMSDGFFVTIIEFDGNNYSYTCGKKMGRANFSTATENIPWQEFKSFESNYKVNEDITSVRLKFKIKVEGALYLNTENGNNAKSATYTEGFVMLVPTEKAESFKKGIMRLVELAKATNKDPFSN